MNIRVKTRLISSGFVIQVGAKSYPVKYPSKIWNSFPRSLRLPFADMVTYIRTVHLGFAKDNFIHYEFPAPWGEAIFNYGLLLAMPENIFDYPKSRSTLIDYIRLAFNNYFKISFSGVTRNINPQVFYKVNKNSSLLPFSFGKDSLLSLAVGKEIGLQMHPIFMLDSDKKFENKHKLKLKKNFEKEFGISIDVLPVPAQELQQKKGMWWGWDLMLTQYTFFLIPYMHHYRAEYFFWSNEYERNFADPDADGFLAALTFDQSGHWLQTLASTLKMYGCPLTLSSPVEILSELGVLTVLHKRFPQVGKYQSSCFNEESTAKTQRWCGRCDECGKVYLFLTALEIDPYAVDLTSDLLSSNNPKLFPFLQKMNEKQKYWWSKFHFYHQEMIYAFYLARRRGNVEYYIDLFNKKYPTVSAKRMNEFLSDYLKLKLKITLSESLRFKLSQIYEKELQDMRKQIRKL